jgi:hypothetical protein
MKNIGICVLIATALLAMSCTAGWRKPDSNRMNLCMNNDYKGYLSPAARGDSSLVRLGMHTTEVMKLRLCIRERRVLVHPSGSRDGCEAEYGGVHYVLAFDGEGRLCHISSSSRGVILEGGTGPGSTLAGIEGAYGEHRLFLMRGYGRMVPVRGGEVFGFEWDGSETVGQEERASWVELTHIPRAR